MGIVEGSGCKLAALEFSPFRFRDGVPVLGGAGLGALGAFVVTGGDCLQI